MNVEVITNTYTPLIRQHAPTVFASVFGGDALGRHASWHIEPLGNIDFSTQMTSGGVYHVMMADIAQNGRHAPHELVVKVLKSPAGCVLPDGTIMTQEMADNEGFMLYWRREALAYQSGLFDHLPPGLRAARVFEITFLPDTILLWQEALAEVSVEVSADDRAWSWSDYQQVAYLLGRWNGQYLTGQQPLPDESWLSQHWLHDWVNLPLTKIMEMLDGMNAWEHPLLRAFFAPEEIATLRRQWDEREQTLALLDAMPRTVAHLDAYRSNLFKRPSAEDNEFVLVDWAFFGLAAPGEELAALVGATLLLGHVPVEDAEQLEAAVWAGYCEGLTESGWTGDCETKRLETMRMGYRRAMTLRYGIMSLGSMVRAAVDPEFACHWEQQVGRSLADILASRAALVRYFINIKCEMTVGL